MPIYIARLKRDIETHEVILYPIEDDRVVELHPGDEFVTIQTKVPLF